MIIYNVTVNIEDSVHDVWKKWMIEKHIPDVMNTGLFKEYRFSKVLAQVEGDMGTNYSIQYLCENIEKLQEYHSKHAQALQKEHTDKFEGKFAAFRTLLEVQHHG